jgi:Ca-activated chloride channel family protein
MFRFAHTYYFYLLLLIPLFVAAFILFLVWRRKALNRFGNRVVIQKLMPEFSNAKLILKIILLLVAYVFLVIAIAGPQTGSKLEDVKRKGIDLMIALDVSNSMLAEDIKPNRLGRAKQAISRLIDNLEGDRIGIVVFAGKAFIQLPITTDYGAAKMFLSTINTNIITTQGTVIADALEMAASSFGESKHNKAIVIITDGEDHQGNVLEQTEGATKKGINIYTIGMGSAEGSPIPIYNGNVQTGYKKDREGNTIITRLDETLLQRMASIGNGIYVRANNSETGLQKIFEEINKIQKTEIESRQFSDYENRFQYFLAITLIFLIFELFVFDKKNQWFSKFEPFKKP